MTIYMTDMLLVPGSDDGGALERELKQALNSSSMHKCAQQEWRPDIVVDLSIGDWSDKIAELHEFMGAPSIDSDGAIDGNEAYVLFTNWSSYMHKVNDDVLEMIDSFVTNEVGAGRGTRAAYAKLGWEYPDYEEPKQLEDGNIEGDQVRINVLWKFDPNYVDDGFSEPSEGFYLDDNPMDDYVND